MTLTVPQLRHQTPGTINLLLNPGHVNRKEALDPDHPAWRQWLPNRRALPVLHSPALTLRLFPSGMLGRPAPVELQEPFKRPFTPWREAVRAKIEEAQEHDTPLMAHVQSAVRDGRAHMSLVFASSLKRQGKRRYLRVSSMRALKQAINLIVTRGAQAGDLVRGRRQLILDEQDGQANVERWVLAGWTYVFFTSLEMHTMTQADVVSFLRPMLRKAWDAAVAMETEWLRHDADVNTTKLRIEQPDVYFPRTKGSEASSYSVRAGADTRTPDLHLTSFLYALFDFNYDISPYNASSLECPEYIARQGLERDVHDVSPPPTEANAENCHTFFRHLNAQNPRELPRCSTPYLIEHFEYYWGMQKGELDLESPLNHIELRLDMSERLRSGDWTLIPTPETLGSMLRMAEYNKTAPIHARKHYLLEFPAQEYEYDVIPLCMLEEKPPTLYVHGGARPKTYRPPYKDLPRIRSSAHPFFVVWVASEQIDMNASSYLPEEDAQRLTDALGDIVDCWDKQPPEAFLIGPDVWKQHRHPLSDDGQEADAALRDSRKDNVLIASNTRKTTRAPCRQPKTVAKAKPYARYDDRRAADRGSALPRPGIQSVERPEGYIAYDLPDLRTWNDRARIESTSTSLSWSSTWLHDEAASDDVLARYRRESARDAEDALHPQSTINGGGLVLGRGEDRSRFSSNNWAMRACGVCLWTLDNPYDVIKEIQ
ncbi:uncharacterized protein SCHCODRAFT_0237694 [Schizophyllum commune H4-8]|uniref:HNH nuclease domain-containing protein n=1 Tax=Schizophyllum commune (strain H4-8 / FGSC 9210) TaxID=578458 RepID=D8QGV0_SCHCM|nr:uncharacterized protein SCHCODRAFT_0237694 [Schizophyllum commune H4-8]KAI5886897.1 hypothetical protein SCHCODRAFT_0237694 [Schizophyllum commune H4-8]